MSYVQPINLESLRDMALDPALVEEMSDEDVTKLLLGLQACLPRLEGLRVHNEETIPKISPTPSRELLMGIVNIANQLDKPVRA